MWCLPFSRGDRIVGIHICVELIVDVDETCCDEEKWLLPTQCDGFWDSRLVSFLWSIFQTKPAGEDKCLIFFPGSYSCLILCVIFRFGLGLRNLYTNWWLQLRWSLSFEISQCRIYRIHAPSFYNSSEDLSETSSLSSQVWNKVTNTASSPNFARGITLNVLL